MSERNSILFLQPPGKAQQHSSRAILRTGCRVGIGQVALHLPPSGIEHDSTGAHVLSRYDAEYFPAEVSRTALKRRATLFARFKSRFRH